MLSNVSPKRFTSSTPAPTVDLKKPPAHSSSTDGVDSFTNADDLDDTDAAREPRQPSMAEFRVRKLDHEAADSPITPDADLARHGHTPTIDGMEQPDMVDVRPDKKPGGYFRSGGKGNLFSLIGSGALGLAVAGALMPLGIAMPPLFAVAGLGGFAAFVISRGGSWTLPKWISKLLHRD